MTIKIQFLKTPAAAASTLVLPIFSSKKLDKLTSPLTPKTTKALLKAINDRPDFKAAAGETLAVTLHDHDAFNNVVILGCGDKKEFDQTAAETAGGKLYVALKNAGTNHATLHADLVSDQSHNIAGGATLRSYSFDKYKTGDNKPKNTFKRLDLVADNTAEAKAAFKTVTATIDGVFLARDLVNEAPNVLYPEAYANIIKDELKPLGVTVTVLDEKKMDKLGMGAIMAVGQGSARKPRMVIMEWNGTNKAKKKKGAQPIALVGKGVTFDTGGISIKPGAGMDEMKMDMGGSAAVVGAMKALAANKAKSHVVAIVGLAENMPSSNAYRPGDIITSYSGKTIEVLNTDAEGRLVLADALTYIQELHNPHTVIDLATLTGAMMVALGHEYCGTFVNNDTLWNDLDKAAKIGQEKIWRMPLDEVWTKEVVSDVADLRNLGKSRFAGASTAAAFLGHFVDKDRKWAHMDIAGTAWVKADKPVTPKYGTGFGVRTLEQLVRSNSEK